MKLLEKYIQVVRTSGLNTMKDAYFGGNVTVVGTFTAAQESITSEIISTASANAFAVGPNGTTNPAFNVATNNSSAVTGINVISNSAGNAARLVATSSGTNEPFQIDAKGSGAIQLGTNSTGPVVAGRGAHKTIIQNTTTLAIATQNGSPTAADMQGGLINHVSVTGAGTLTLPTGSTLTAAMPNAAVGDTIVTMYANTGTQTVTITTNTGLTLYGTLAVPAGKTALIYTTLLGSNSCAVYIALSA